MAIFIDRGRKIWDKILGLELWLNHLYSQQIKFIACPPKLSIVKMCSQSSLTHSIKNKIIIIKKWRCKTSVSAIVLFLQFLLFALVFLCFSLLILCCLNHRLLLVSSELSRIILIDFTGYRIGFTVHCSNLLDYFPPAISFLYVNKQWI